MHSRTGGLLQQIRVHRNCKLSSSLTPQLRGPLTHPCLQQALFGKKYVAAAKDAWNLLKKRGIDALINDCLVNNIWWVWLDSLLRARVGDYADGAWSCRTLLSLTSGALGALFSYLYLHIVRPSYIENNTSLYAVAMLYRYVGLVRPEVGFFFLNLN